jgi:hypothetical protein
VRKETERERRKKWNGEIRIGTDRGDEDGAAMSCYCLLRETRGIFAAGGGNRNSGELQSSETEQRQRRKRKGVSQGLVCDFRKLQGPLGKNNFNHYSRAQTKMWPK